MKEHDLDALVECFKEDYESEQPMHPARRFRGRDQVWKNWSRMFGEIPDFQADLVRSTIDGDLIWAECSSASAVDSRSVGRRRQPSLAYLT